MEETILRFPVIAEQIFDQLDDQNLTKFRGISRTWYDATERLQWIRKIKDLTKHNPYSSRDHQISWKLVLVKIPTHVLEKLAVTLDWEGWKRCPTPLHTAVYSGDLQLFEHIYEKSKDKNPQDPDGRTPFHAAAEHGSLEIFKFIMERAEDKNPNMKFGRTTLHLAAAHGHLEICKLISENISSLDSVGSDCSCLYCGLMLDVGCWMFGCNNGRTPLHEAAIGGHLETYKFIAERVKEINPKDRDGKTPLRLAEEKGRYEICRLIRSLPPYVSIFQAYNQIKQRDAKLSNPEKKRRKKK
jgi:ankyrin repeat protein